MTHPDPFAGETPTKQIVAVRSLYLYRSPTDASPLKVFDLDSQSVEVDLVTGEKKEVASVAVKSLIAGVFTLAKAGVAYVRYSVGARMHGAVALDGAYDNVQALSEGAVIDGVAQRKGHFTYTFVSNGQTIGSLTGENAPMPAVSSGGGLSIDTSGPEGFYVFPVQVAIDPNVTVDQEALLEVNVHESFRWQDQTADGYSPNVFDTTPSTFEPIMAFGGNAYTLTIAGKVK